ncbi:MAG: PKD domain-containing protein [candidate division Zixibacteria bacterium]|nr:PKD domain-containing protein [candidate division Zixibacteria bacterium]
MVRIRFISIMVTLGVALLLLSPGCDELITETIEITIAGHPTAEFRIVNDSGCLLNGEFLVDFEDASSGSIIRWVWDFGDGTFDTLYLDSGDSGDISHAYNSIGSYTVNLSVFDTTIDGAGLETKKRAVIVGHSIDSMTISDFAICPGDSVTLTAHNPFGVAHWRWSFGDGTVRLDSNPVQTYAWTDPGLYLCSLSVNGDCGQTLIIDSVNVMHCGAPYFTVDTAEGCVPMYVQFTDMTPTPIIDSTTSEVVGTIVLWLFDFGVGTPQQYDYAPNVIDVEYTVAGTYEVSLTVTTDSGGVTTYYDTIIAHPGDASFAVAPNEGCQISGRQFAVAFTREPSGDTAWLWDFGDGDTSHAQNPYHVYVNPGIYDVSLAAFGACGDSVATFDSTAMITYSDTLADDVLFSVVQNPHLDSSLWYTFTDTSQPAIVVNRIWDFGDNTSNPTAISVTHLYADSTHSYTVTLTRTNTCDSLSGDTVISVTSTGGGK